MPNANEVFRDFERFTGDGRPNAPAGAPLPVGDPQSGVKNPSKAEIRAWAAEIEALNGNPDALNARLQTIEGLATPSYASRAAAEAAASTLPTSVTQILVREDGSLTVRSRTASVDDPLYPTGARWGVMLRLEANSRNVAGVSGDDWSAVTWPGATDTVIQREIDGGGRLRIWAALSGAPSTVDPLIHRESAGGRWWRKAFDSNSQISEIISVRAEMRDGRVWNTANNDLSFQTPPLGTDQISVAADEGHFTWRTSAEPIVVNPLIHQQDDTGQWWRLSEDTVKIKADIADLADATVRGDATFGTPIIVVDGTVPLWLDDEGKLAAADLSPQFKALATSEVAQPTDWNTEAPILTAGEAVFMTVTPDGADIPWVSKALADRLADARNDWPATSDGRSLFMLRAKRAAINRGDGGKLKVLMIGDSWAMRESIPRGLVDVLAGGSPAGDGWLSAMGTALAPSMTGASLTYANLTLTDGNTTASYPNGLGPDGQILRTTGTTGTITVTALRATEIHIFRRQYGATWRYRIDGGAWVTVADNASATGAFVSITALSDTVHSLDIDTTVNAGSFAFGGIYSTRSVDGVEIARFGNGGNTAFYEALQLPYMAESLALIQPDVIIHILGTNDYRSEFSPITVFSGHIRKFDAQVRAILPSVGIIRIVPAQSVDTTPETGYSLSLIRDAIRRQARNSGGEYIDLMASFENKETDASGVWEDDVHVNGLGGWVVAEQINDAFFKIG